MILTENFGSLQDMATQHLLAPVFLTLKASVALSTGDLFIFDNTLYKATANIAQDADIVIGTNAAVASTITEELKDHAGEVTFTPDTTNVNTNSTFSIYRDNHVVTVKMAIKTKIAYSGTTYTIGTFADKPKSAVYFPLIPATTGYITISASTGIATLNLYSDQSISAGATIYCCGCYYID